MRDIPSCYFRLLLLPFSVKAHIPEKGDPKQPSPLPIWLLLSCVVNRRRKVVADSQRPAQAAPYRECSAFFSDKEIGQGVQGRAHRLSKVSKIITSQKKNEECEWLGDRWRPRPPVALGGRGDFLGAENKHSRSSWYARLSSGA